MPSWKISTVLSLPPRSFDVMNTRAFFRSPSKEIAEFAAGEIGEKEILKASEQYSYGADPVRDGVSTGKEKERETLVSYSDIQTLPDLSCYVTLPGPVSGREAGPEVQTTSENCRGIYSALSRYAGGYTTQCPAGSPGSPKAVLQGRCLRRMHRRLIQLRKT
ncbi:DNA transport protein TraD [Raoultella planticola]|uniref:DNA transport protein TraD n=1 Tax=Raoultella planticola TaxID=575 RepID=A0A485D498_RAOPL|nr:DNA transport protein TraD [Raoultella planticola]